MMLKRFGDVFFGMLKGGFRSTWGRVIFSMVGGVLCFTGPAHADVFEKCARYQLIDAHIHVVKIDLHCPGLKFYGTEEKTRGRTTSQFAHDAKLDIAINANFFDRATFEPNGHVVTNGNEWSSEHHASELPTFACDAADSCQIFPHARAEELSAASIAVSGMQYYAEGAFHCPANLSLPCHGKNWEKTQPRTVVGLDAGGSILFMIVVEGRVPSFTGLTIDQLGRLLTRLGVASAVNLDGGGSSTLVFRGRRMNAIPADQLSERPVANHLGIRFGAEASQ